MSKNGSQTKKWHFAKVGAHLKNRREKGGVSLNNENFNYFCKHSSERVLQMLELDRRELQDRDFASDIQDRRLPWGQQEQKHVSNFSLFLDNKKKKNH